MIKDLINEAKKLIEKKRNILIYTKSEPLETMILHSKNKLVCIYIIKELLELDLHSASAIYDSIKLRGNNLTATYNNLIGKELNYKPANIAS